MSARIISCQVNNEYVIGAGVPIGAAGSYNDVILELTFNEMWDGLTKKITWLDANGQNPVITVLTADLLKTGTTNVYLVPIPGEPKAYAGEITMTLRGVDVEGSTASSATLSTSATFRVLPSDYSYSADEISNVTPDQATQLQGQIDAILSDINDAIEAKDAAETSASEAAQSASAAAASESNAAESETNAASAASAAQTSQNAAESYATSAAASATTATEKAAAAAQSEQNAAESKTAAASSASSAAQLVSYAQTSASEAAASAAAADESRVMATQAYVGALNAKDSAVAAQNNAETAKNAAESAQAAAEKARDEAQEIAGGDFASKTEAKGYANTAEANAKAYTDTAEQNAKAYADSLSSNYDAAGSAADAESAAKGYADLKLAAKADLIGGKVPSEQLPAMDYAPAYTYGTTDLTAGSSPLETGKLYFVYE